MYFLPPEIKSLDAVLEKKRTTPPMHKEVHLPHDPDVKHPNPILASEQRPKPKPRE